MEEQFNNLNGLESINKLIESLESIKKLKESFDILNHNFEKLTKCYKTINSSPVIKALSTFTNKIIPNLQQEKTATKLSSFTIGQEIVPTEATKGAKETVTGGTRNTQITINLGKMTENVVFNGTLGEKREELITQFREMMLQVLYSAADANI